MFTKADRVQVTHTCELPRHACGFAASNGRLGTVISGPRIDGIHHRVNEHWLREPMFLVALDGVDRLSHIAESSLTSIALVPR